VVSVNQITSQRSVKPGPGELAGTDFATLIEAVYRMGADDTDWLGDIVASARPGLDRGRGLVGCLFAVGSSGVPTVSLALGAGALPARPATLAAAFLPALVGRAGSGRASTICGTARAPRDSGARSVSGVVAFVHQDGTDSGCALLAPLPHGEGLSRQAAAIWARIADHLGAALRIRQAASNEWAIWWGLLSGRWRLVDQFDAAGRRFVIARGRPRPASKRALGHLTGRERDACAGAAEGRANKVIAAELGVAVSTVGTLLSRAPRKLGCRSRAELIRAFRSGEELRRP
jgi:DNA-binding CsgD family transcriptional regulator